MVSPVFLFRCPTIRVLKFVCLVTKNYLLNKPGFFFLNASMILFSNCLLYLEGRSECVCEERSNLILCNSVK